MKCTECGATQKVLKDQTVAYDFGGLPDVTLRGLEVRVCTNGHRDIGIPAIDGLHKAIAGWLMQKPASFAPNEIRFLRKYLGWSQADFASRMGVTPESVSRWESGAVLMAPTAERLVRLMVQTTLPVQDYRLFDLFTKLKDQRAPGQMQIVRSGQAWKVKAA